MVLQCFAFGCKHVGLRDTCKMYCFPKDKKLFKVWRDACRRKDSEPKYYARLCSCHFLNGDKTQRPTIFSFNQRQRSYFAFKSPEKRVRRSAGSRSAQNADISPGDGQPPTETEPPRPTSSETTDPVLLDDEELPPSAIMDPEEATHDDEDLCTAQLPSVEYLLKSLADADNLNSRLQRDLDVANSKLEMLASSSQKPGNYLSFAFFGNDASLFHYYTGLPNFNSFAMLLKLLSSSSLNYYDNWKPQKPLEDQLLLTLVKLRLNPDYTDMSTRFQISRQAVRNIFLTITYALHTILFSSTIRMPSRSKNRTVMSNAFSNFTNCRVIIDSTEVQCAVPRNSLDKRVIGRLKTYTILDHVPGWLKEHTDVIFQVVGCLINLHPPLSRPMETNVSGLADKGDTVAE